MTLPPLQPLVTEIMRGTGAPELLAIGDAHGGLISPKQAERLAKADIIILADAGMNLSLTQLVAKRQKPGATIITLTELGGADPEPYATENAFSAGYEPPKEEKKPVRSAFDKPKPSRTVQETGGMNPHIWLDPLRMADVVESLAEAMGKAYPARAETYRYNASLLADRLRGEVHMGLKSMLASAKPSSKAEVVPYLPYHDSYGYFLARYGLADTGYIIQRPEGYIGAASMKALVESARTQKVHCLISEGANPLSKRLAVLAEAKIVVLNPERLYDAKDTPSFGWVKNDYDRLLARVGQTFSDCIRGKKL